MKDDNYTYLEAGFNRFFRRSIASNPDATSLRSRILGSGGSRELAFDRQQVSGQLGDILKIGNIHLDGKKGQLTVSDGERVRVLLGFDPEGF